MRLKALCAALIISVLLLFPIGAVGQVQPQFLVGRGTLRAIDTLLEVGKGVFKIVPNDDIARYAAKAAKNGGPAEVAQELQRLNFHPKAIEDTYARILIRQGHTSRPEAQVWMKNLSGVEGFSMAMRKSMGANSRLTTGHLTEIRIANAGAEYGYRVKGIGVRFRPPSYKQDSDIDVLFEHKGRDIAVESKNVASVDLNTIINFRGDMEVLKAYRDAYPARRVLPVFWSVKPIEPSAAKRLRATANQLGVAFIEGDGPDSGIYQVDAHL